MRLCPQCGTENPAEAKGCLRCAAPLGLEQTVVGHNAPVQQARFRGTMLGLSPPELLPQAQPAAVQPPVAPYPLPGPPPTPQAEAAAPATGRQRLHQTMIGLAPPEDPLQKPRHPTPEPGYPPTAGPPAAEPGYTQGPGHPPLGLGHTQPLGISAQPPAQPAPEGPPAAGQNTQHWAPAQKTMLGVARPGIAPLNPSQAKPPTSAPAPASASRSVEGGAPSARRAQAPLHTLNEERPSKRGVPLVAAIAIVAAGALFTAAGVVWLFYRGHGSIEARASVQADGSEQLQLTCAACENGTVARLDAANATFTAQHAALPLSRPLKVGENPMTVTLVSATGKQSFVDISVPIAFRVRADTTGLEAATPELRVLVNALPGSIATVDGKPLALSPAGEGTYVIDVSAQVTGLEPAVKTLERRVPYEVTPPTGPTQKGSVDLQAGITPLVIDAPGSSVVLDASNFVLAGRTAKAGALTVSDRPITVDPSGRFAQMMNVSAPGETTITIRATSKDSAPRLFPLRVRRVDSLQHEAERVRQRATSSYAAIADQTDSKRGWAVALDGSVVDARTDNYTTVAVMDVQSGCAHAPCLARITYGAPFSLARGDKFSAFGAISGTVDGPRTGTRIPEIRADFLLKVSK